MRLDRFALIAAVGASVVSLSCSDSRTPDITDPPSLAASQGTCQFNIINDLVRSYLPGSAIPQVKALLTQMEAAFKSGDKGGAANRGFDILVFVENAANGGAVGTPAAGSSLVNALLPCMNINAAQDFSEELGPGAFGVRGGPNDPTGPILSRDSVAGIGLAPGASWPQVLGRRVIIFGRKDPTAVFNELLVGNGYEWTSLPVLPQVNPGAILGVCVNNPGPRLRIERVPSGGSNQILNQSNANFLACPAVVLGAGAGINAAGPVGGSVKGFSDFGPVDAIAINLSYLRQPSTVVAGAIISPAVQIQARGNGTTPLPEVTMTLSLVQVSGSGSLSGTVVKLTGVSGIETFPDLRVSAPGTYALMVTATLNGFTPVQLQSANFTVTP
jgi:hypothetical protein